MLATFTQEPRRGRVTAAKALAVAILTGVGAVFAALCAVLSLAVAGLVGRDVSWHLSPVAPARRAARRSSPTWRSGSGWVSCCRTPPAAIVRALRACPFVFGLLGTVIKDVGNWVDFTRTTTWLSDGDFAGHVPFMIVSSLLWVVAPVVAGVVRTARREVN